MKNMQYKQIHEPSEAWGRNNFSCMAFAGSISSCLFNLMLSHYA